VIIQAPDAVRASWFKCVSEDQAPHDLEVPAIVLIPLPKA
jgi:hypothetical protein